MLMLMKCNAIMEAKHLGCYIDPLGKFVNGDEQVGEATSCPLQWSNQVEPPKQRTAM
jgi:hypothetical protein